MLKDSLYVDDFAGGADNDQEAIEIYTKSQGIMENGGFRLRKWNSNSKVLKDKIKEDTLLRTSQTNTSLDNEGDEKMESLQPSKTSVPVTTLGCSWNVEADDKFQFGVQDLNEYVKSLPPTKRSVLKASAKIF